MKPKRRRESTEGRDRRPSRRVRPVVAVVFFCLFVRPVVRPIVFVRPVLSFPSSPSSFSVRPSVPSFVPSSSSVLRLLVSVRRVVVHPLSVRPVVRLVITYMASRSIRWMGTDAH